ncbi:MAG: cytochrome c [Campylobacterales bacterium]|nr:cytochrome c [Campylobacterales bacterium]
MLKTLLLSALLAAFAFSGAQAHVYKGQKEYIKNCKECHAVGKDMANSKTQRDWEKLLSEQGTTLANLHLKNQEAEASHDYFSSRKYEKNVNHLLDFLKEFAKDSGNVPACD